MIIQGNPITKDKIILMFYASLYGGFLVAQNVLIVVPNVEANFELAHTQSNTAQDIIDNI